ncbi:MAG TPA: hypothetical protein VJN88_08370, partial [Ktedonobacterales bacterium]|nr:hypothetical protein [Ktedonobacterales bacterium]
MFGSSRFASLPDEVFQLLSELHAPPRLVAHLAIVHDTAMRIVAAVDAHWPTLAYDRARVMLGAATHDIGKVIYPAGLSALGHEHEAAGEQLLLAHGFDADCARFARTHG